MGLAGLVLLEDPREDLLHTCLLANPKGFQQYQALKEQMSQSLPSSFQGLFLFLGDCALTGHPLSTLPSC